MLNGTMLQYFHWYYPNDGSLWSKLIKDIPLLKKLGINAVWLPPAYKDSSEGKYCGYDTYDLFDLGEFDQKGSVRTKYGTKDEYIAAIEAAHTANICVYVDIVINHKAGADETEKCTVVKVNPENRNEVISEPYEAELYTKFSFPGREGKYSSFNWDWNCFTGVDYCAKPRENGIFRILNEWGDGWENTVAQEFGNYDYLMFTDIEFRNPVVREELKYWGRWYYELTKFDGVRLDAVKHIAPEFFNEWLDYMRAFAGKEFFAVGELWTGHDLPLLQEFISQTNRRMHLFDSILHSNFYNAANQGKEFDLRNIFQNTLVSVEPELAVTLVDNHDTQPLQAMEAPVQEWFKPHAYALTLLRKEGYPCVFYADLFGTKYSDKKDGKDVSITMNATAKLDLLLQARNNFAYGEQHDYFDDANCIAWVREGLDEMKGSGCIVVLTNGDNASKHITAGPRFCNKQMRDYLGNVTELIQTDHVGAAEFPVNAGSISVWVLNA